MKDDDDHRRDIVPREEQPGDAPQQSGFHLEIELGGAYADEQVNGPRLLSHDELDRARRQAHLAASTRAARIELDQREKENREKNLRERIRTIWLAVFLVLAVVAFIVAMVNGITLADASRFLIFWR